MKENEPFELLLDHHWFRKGDILNQDENISLKVLSEPKKYYNKWYWKILNFITFKIWFNYKVTYTVKIIE
jgi:hypothetical protein